MGAVTFDAREAEAVARALAAVAAADGAIKAREEIFLDGFAVQHGVASATHISQPFDEAALARAVRDGDKRREVVRLCLKMAFADREFVPAEAHVIARIATAFEIGEPELNSLVDAARAAR
jgi:uncharacterized tellurite resistance protein B-like protein